MATRTTKSKTTSRTSTRKRRKRKSSLSALIELVFISFWGRVLLTGLFAVALIAANMLISNNQFDLFFRLAGIEVFVIAAFFWLRFALKKN